MICFDTNIIIYLANGTLSEEIISDKPIFYPSIVYIETLGYPRLLSAEELRIKELFHTMTELPLTENIISLATHLKQLRNISLADSIVAATALEHNLELWTANTKDFKNVDNLRLNNPLSNHSDLG
ncbi:MAG TPA: type II toxin-antitoxin system VapC family toxin [Candidatus Saccharimonadales bacterium]|nr:type II toxin-antitoxin system VapC family toxin [Candidatus Saccharimonadales bacterium]